MTAEVLTLLELGEHGKGKGGICVEAMEEEREEDGDRLFDGDFYLFCCVGYACACLRKRLFGRISSK